MLILQGACFLIIRPLSKNTYRRIVGAVTEIFFLVMVFLVNWLAGLEVLITPNILLHHLVIFFIYNYYIEKVIKPIIKVKYTGHDK